jgi:hypothetical protein
VVWCVRGPWSIPDWSLVRTVATLWGSTDARQHHPGRQVGGLLQMSCAPAGPPGTLRFEISGFRSSGQREKPIGIRSGARPLLPFSSSPYGRAASARSAEGRRTRP